MVVHLWQYRIGIPAIVIFGRHQNTQDVILPHPIILLVYKQFLRPEMDRNTYLAGAELKRISHKQDPGVTDIRN